MFGQIGKIKLELIKESQKTLIKDIHIRLNQEKVDQKLEKSDQNDQIDDRE